ncbi:hypothetical protein CCR94_21515 [Rhodoblastus sphagnicola]|uniref:Uncharacterized protein n=1 Tax=Rhodoblastus sphagnicola TaxID=333368 RepID=A0A2S6MWV1_9HYPH|nr:hypothetical protein [Rhodoblastus sphagnicola]MBB4200681.1 hypothetical protein [Rhodoblastus sphagnicola]PPQ26844.1 hypothetical protein CCR94_21515 [Rhodoblastus sphagnicola]
MTISYTLTDAKSAPNAQPVMRSDGAFIPADPRNTDFQVYLSWLSNGGAPGAAPNTASAVPTQVSRRQFFQAAAQDGLITNAEAIALISTGAMPASLSSAIAALPNAEQFAAQMAVLGDQTFERSSLIVVALAAAMNKTNSDLDALFTLAASL